MPFVEIDPSLTLSVLQAANAPHLRQSRRVATVRRAMVLLGTSAVEAIATSRTAALVLDPADVGCPPGFWVRAIAAASASSVIAGRLGSNMDEAFTAGMVHDVGDLIMYRSDPELHGIVVARVASGGRSLLDQEKVLFGRTHTDVGADRLENSLIPERIVKAVRWHHAAPEALTETLARAVWAGIRIGAVVAGSPIPPGGDETYRPEAVLRVVGLAVDDLKSVVADTEARVNRILSLAGSGQ